MSRTVAFPTCSIHGLSRNRPMAFDSGFVERFGFDFTQGKATTTGALLKISYSEADNL